jgi:hypothetical protein
MLPMSPKDRSSLRRRRSLTAMAGIVALSASSLVGLGLTAATASASVTGTTGGASGLTVTGLLPLGPVPKVVLPPDGSPQNLSAASEEVPGVVSTGVLTVSTGATGVPGAAGQVTSMATVNNTSVPVATLGVGAVTTTCTSDASGSTATTTVANLTIGGSAVNLPNPIPPNYGLSVPGVATIELNRQVTSEAPGSTSMTVDGLDVQLLGVLGGLSTSITVAASTCGATGPDVNAAPGITSVDPNKGPEAGGTAVTITGSDFNDVTGVDFGTTPGADVVVDSPTQLTVTSPPGDGTVDVTVTDAKGTSPADPAEAFTYIPAPTVTGVNPDTGPAAGGQMVTVTGTDLSGASAVHFGPTPATIISCTDTTCVVSSPAGTAGSTVPVTVTTASGTSAPTPVGDYIYGSVPAVTSVSPTAGPMAGGNTVTVTGANLDGATGVDFGTVPGTIVSPCTASSCTVTAPAGTPGTVDVTITTAEGTSATSPADDYSYDAPPVVTGISPITGPETGGTPVTITGTGLCDPTAVDFGGTPASAYTVNQACTEITAVSPPGSGAVDVTVTTPGGVSPTGAVDQFTYAPLPVIESISPSSGPLAGGTDVTLTGSGLLGASAIDFGSTPASNFSCLTNTTCTVFSPPASQAGSVPVMATTAGGTSNESSAPRFAYVAGPSVSSISPNTGPAAGGTMVTVTGSGLSGTTAIDFGSTPGTIIGTCTDMTCTVTSPAGTAGDTVPVTATTPDGTSDPSPAGDFTYGDAPAVDGLSPTSGPVAGGTSVTITGANLTGGTVDFGATPATDVTCTATSCTATSPAGTGTVHVVVTTPSGPSAMTPADEFTYIPVPTVIAISPLSGPTAGGTTVTITGTGLTGTTAIDFGSLPSTSFTCTSDTSCTAVSPPSPAGDAHVIATTPGGVSAAAPDNLFTYVSPYPYHSVTPYRIADTRPRSGEPLAGDTLHNGDTATVQVTGTGTLDNGVPSDATVAVLNVTEVDATGVGYFTAYPTGNARPTASNLNFTKKATVPNLVEVAIGSGGQVNIYNHGGSADLVVDVEGYVAPPTTIGDTAGLYNPLSPARITDTRKASGEPNAGKTLGSGVKGQPSATLSVQVTGQGGVPTSGVSAVVLNVTATNDTALGYVTVYPDGATRPLASNLNTVPGTDVANRVIVPVGADGKIDLFNHAGSTDIVVDVDGWFTNGRASAGDVYSGVQPQRIADTRPGSDEPEAGKTLGAGRVGDPSSLLTMTVAGTGGIPSMSSPKRPTSVVLNVTVTDTTAVSYLTVFPAGETRPVASDLNWSPKTTHANLVVVKLSPSGQISMFNWAGKADVAVDVVGYYSSSQSGT